MNASVRGKLYMIPVTLGDHHPSHVLTPSALQLIQRLKHFVVENEKTARHFLGNIPHPLPIRDLHFSILDQHTPDKALASMLEKTLSGEDIGLMSEAGCPGVADPGARLAALAHTLGIHVVPLVGPSAILLALMASGLNGQQFRFIGYLPSEKTARIEAIREVEHRSRNMNETQIFIETPYRNPHLLADLIQHSAPSTLLCVACQLTMPDELIVTKNIADWRRTERPDLHKKPTVFLLLSVVDTQTNVSRRTAPSKQAKTLSAKPRKVLISTQKQS